MLEVVVYKKNGLQRAAIGDIIFYDNHEKRLLDVVQNYVENLGDYTAIAFYREKEEFPFLVKSFI